MPSTQELLKFRGRDLKDRDGDKIGKVDEIYEDTDTGAPEWALVNTGLFGSKSTFVPLRDAMINGDDLRVPYEKAQVKDAPGIDTDGALSHDEERRLYDHYGLDWSTSSSDSQLPEGGATGGASGADYESSRGTVGHDVSGPTTDEAMTRSEEELRVGTTQR
jgi:sporulation protein YlmC with PRC-barrel domain